MRADDIGPTAYSADGAKLSLLAGKTVRRVSEVRDAMLCKLSRVPGTETDHRATDGQLRNDGPRSQDAREVAARGACTITRGERDSREVRTTPSAGTCTFGSDATMTRQA